jgi:DNA-binding NarL/FixJ family response regulator
LSRFRIVLADDRPDVLETVARLLEPKYQVVENVRDGQALIDAVTCLKPELVVTDISMPVLSGIEAATKLAQSGSAAIVIFLTVHEDADFIRAGLQAGALGYVIKSRLATDLVAAIQQALAGKIFVSHAHLNHAQE